MAFQHRGASRHDAPAIVEFQLAMARETENVTLDREVCTRGVDAVFDDPSRGRYFATEADGQVVASLLITYEWSDWRDGVVWWIQSVYVVASHRGRGVYASLHRHVRDRARAMHDVVGLRLYVERENTRAQATYRRLGMRETSYLLYEETFRASSAI